MHGAGVGQVGSRQNVKRGGCERKLDHWRLVPEGGRPCQIDGCVCEPTDSEKGERALDDDDDERKGGALRKGERLPMVLLWRENENLGRRR